MVRSEVARIDDVGTSRKLITYSTKNRLHPSVQAVMSNDDLLIEILLRLPITSLHIFKPVSKRWLSLITDAKFLERRGKIPKVDSPSGLFLPLIGDEYNGYDFLPFDTKVSVSIQLFTEVGNKLRIKQSCNGLLLCYMRTTDEFYAYNPCLKMFKVLPDSINLFFNPYWNVGGVQMAFNPTKSPHYKIIHAVPIEDDDENQFSIQIKIYSSETCSLSVCGDPFSFDIFRGFEDGIYCNGAIHWLNIANNQLMHFKLDIEKLPVLTMSPTPATVGGYRYRGYQLFESRGCLLLFCWVSRDNPHFNIYEKRNENSEWSLKYVVILNEAMLPLPKTPRMPLNWDNSSVLSIVLEEKEQDSFMVMLIDKTVVQYKFVSETIHVLCHNVKPWGFSEIFQFTASFSGV